MFIATFIDKKEGEGKNKKNISVDYTGILLLAVGIGCLQYVLERGEANDWFADRSIQIFAVLTVVSVIGFIIWELQEDEPVVNIRLYHKLFSLNPLRKCLALTGKNLLTLYVLIDLKLCFPA